MIGFLFNGELFLLYADNFQNSYYRTSLAFFQSSRDPENEEIAADFLEAGEKTDVDFYFVDGRIVSEYEKDVNIYGTPEHWKHYGNTASGRELIIVCFWERYL